MAQVIDCYSAEASGSSAMYYYRYPDSTSDATRIYSGEAIYLYKDYGNRITNGMYLMVDPAGWIPWYYVQNIEPVYITVADVCSAPSRVGLDTETKTLAISGGSGGDLNEWIGFGISYRERAINSTVWGEWSQDTVVSNRIVAVSAGFGMVRQYRVRTLGSAGSEYYSDYVVCDTLINGNTVAGTPAILLPVSGMHTDAPSPVIKIECPPEPDGDNMVLQRSVDGGEWTDAATLSATGGIVYDRVPATVGTHVVRYRLMDTSGETGGEDSISFTRAPEAWMRSISTGDVIANREISFVKDIHELVRRVNSLRAFYGMPAVSLPGTPGRIGDWQRQLTAMQNAVNECRTAMNLADAGFAEASAFPQAAQINLLRNMIENT